MKNTFLILLGAASILITGYEKRVCGLINVNAFGLKTGSPIERIQNGLQFQKKDTTLGVSHAEIIPFETLEEKPGTQCNSNAAPRLSVLKLRH